MAASSAPPAQPVVVVSQNIYASTLSYLQGRGLQVQSVPVEEHASAQTYATLWERVPGASGLLTFPEDVVDGPLLKQAGPQLVAVSVCGERAGRVELPACSAAGVVVCATDSALSAASMAELALGHALSLLRRLPAADAAARAGLACAGPYGSLAGAQVGVVGYSALGSALCERLAAFGPATVWYLDTPGEDLTTRAPSLLPFGCADTVPLARAAALPDLLATCDVVFLAAPLTAKSARCIDSAALTTIKTGCVLINASAGSLVDEPAVAAALARGQLGGYACDGFACEDAGPGSAGVQSVPTALVNAGRTQFSTRAGGAVTATRQRVELEAARALAEALDGRAVKSALNQVPQRRAGDRPANGVTPQGWAAYLWCF